MLEINNERPQQCVTVSKWTFSLPSLLQLSREGSSLEDVRGVVSLWMDRDKSIVRTAQREELGPSFLTAF